MKKYLIILLVLMVPFLGGCGDKKIHSEVRSFIQQQEKYINEKDLQRYMGTISKQSHEYYAEKGSWMRDIQNNDIKNYTMNIEELQILDSHHVTAQIKQEYTYNGKGYHSSFPLALIKEDDHWKDNDLLFDELRTEHFTIKYFPSSRNYAKMITKASKEAYDNVVTRYGRGPLDVTTIKVYPDMEMMRQSVKLSFAWQFAGWYEYPESIKTMEFDDEEAYVRVLEHELIHKCTIKDGNNNLPYWFTEGLAVYFADFYHQPKEYNSKSYYLDRYGDMTMNIKKLEKKNLEKIEDTREISNYYDSAGMIVKFMVETYGLPRVQEIINELGKFPYQYGSGAEVDLEAIRRFHRVLKKVLGIDIEVLDNNWEGYLNQS